MKTLYACCFSLCCFVNAISQTKVNHHEGQVWIGYMTTAKLSERLGLWNDVHWASENFFISRHGLTYSLLLNMSITGGFAWGFLGVSDGSLERLELRPWGQIVWSQSPRSDWQIQQRIRYDARFKQQYVQGNLIDGAFDFNHRVRYMLSIKKSLNGQPLSECPWFASLNNEVLLNFGEAIKTNNLDQTRTSLFIGKNFKKSTVQVGYMYRYVPQSTPATYKHYHALTLWIFQNFDFRKNKNAEVTH